MFERSGFPVQSRTQTGASVQVIVGKLSLVDLSIERSLGACIDQAPMRRRLLCRAATCLPFRLRKAQAVPNLQSRLSGKKYRARWRALVVYFLSGSTGAAAGCSDCMFSRRCRDTNSRSDNSYVYSCAEALSADCTGTKSPAALEGLVLATLVFHCLTMGLLAYRRRLGWRRSRSRN